MRYRLALLAAPPLALGLWWLAGPKPSNDRPWVAEQARLPRANLEGDLVHLTEVRASEYRSAPGSRCPSADELKPRTPRGG